METAVYYKCPRGHRMVFDPYRGLDCLNIGWCPHCNKNLKLTPKEQKLVMATYEYGKVVGKAEMRESIRKLFETAKGLLGIG